MPISPEPEDRNDAAENEPNRAEPVIALKPQITPDAVSETKTDPSTGVPTDLPTEYGGQKGPEPTRFGDWEKNGRCTDF